MVISRAATSAAVKFGRRRESLFRLMRPYQSADFRAFSNRLKTYFAVLDHCTAY